MHAQAALAVLLLLVAGCMTENDSPVNPGQREEPGSPVAVHDGSPSDEGENETDMPLVSTGIVSLSDCRGAVPSLNWPREALPWPAPVGYDNDHPLPSARMFAFTCETMDALGLATFEGVSVGVLAHSNVSRPSDFGDIEYDSAIVALETYFSPVEAAALLEASGFDSFLHGRVVTSGVDTELPTVTLESSRGSVGLTAPRILHQHESDIPIVPQTWLALHHDSGNAMSISVSGLSDGLALPGVWNATGSNAFAPWMPDAGPGLPALGAYMHSTDLTIEVVR